MDEEKIVDASRVGLRIGSPVSEPYVLLQFYFPIPDTEEEQRYTVKISMEQMKAIAETYPTIQDEVDLFKTWDDQIEGS